MYEIPSIGWQTCPWFCYTPCFACKCSISCEVAAMPLAPQFAGCTLSFQLPETYTLELHNTLTPSCMASCDAVYLCPCKGIASQGCLTNTDHRCSAGSPSSPQGCSAGGWSHTGSGADPPGSPSPPPTQHAAAGECWGAYTTPHLTLPLSPPFWTPVESVICCPA